MRRLSLIGICLGLSCLAWNPVIAEDATDEYPDDFFEPMNDPVPEADPEPPAPSGPPMLGIQMTPPPSHAQRVNGTTPDQGVYVRRVFPNTAADHMGLQPGDIILSINGTEIDSMTRLREIVNGSEVGDDVSVLITRNGNVNTHDGQFREWLDSVPKRRLDDKAEQRYRDMQKRRLERRMEHAQQRQDNLAKHIDAHKKAQGDLADMPDWNNIDADAFMAKELGLLPDYSLPAIELSGVDFAFHYEVDVDSELLHGAVEPPAELPPVELSPQAQIFAAAVPNLQLQYAFSIDANEL